MPTTTMSETEKLTEVTNMDVVPPPKETTEAPIEQAKASEGAKRGRETEGEDEAAEEPDSKKPSPAKEAPEDAKEKEGEEGAAEDAKEKQGEEGEPAAEKASDEPTAEQPPTSEPTEA